MACEYRRWPSNLLNKRNEQKHVYVADISTLITSIIECTILCSMRQNTVASFTSPPSFLCFAGCITQRFWQHVCTAFCLHRWKRKYVFMQTSGSFGTEHRKRNNLRQKNTRTHHMWNLYFQRVSNVTVSKLCLPNCVQIDVGEFTLVLYAAGRLLPKQEHKYFATIYTWFTRIFFRTHAAGLIPYMSAAFSNRHINNWSTFFFV